MTRSGPAPLRLITERPVTADHEVVKQAPPGRPVLRVLSASESFEAFWPTLAGELNVLYAPLRDAADLRAGTGDLLVVSAAGLEQSLPELLRPLTGRGAPVVAVGVSESRRVAVDVMRAGAAEYFCLPGEVDALRSFIKAQLEAPGARDGVARFVAEQQRQHRFDGIFGASPAMLQAIARAERVIPHDRLTLLLTGETGTGKEVFARAIHYHGPRRHLPFVAVNCAAIPLHLLESELFGHERGAFTGAHAAKPGLFEVADGGTLLLDEIGHLDLTLQGKLLRALEERTIRRVGGAKDIRVDVRVLAATHVNLARAAERGEFRSDLYYRLNVVAITLPPLRERGDDALLLAEHFVRKTAEEYGMPVPDLAEDARALVRRHHWPGNVRELRNAMERATLLASESRIRAADLEVDEAHAAPVAGVVPFPASLATIVRASVRAMIDRHGGNKSAAARQLGISRSRLLRIIDEADDYLEGGE